MGCGLFLDPPLWNVSKLLMGMHLPEKSHYALLGTLDYLVNEFLCS